MGYPDNYNSDANYLERPDDALPRARDGFDRLKDMDDADYAEHKRRFFNLDAECAAILAEME